MDLANILIGVGRWSAVVFAVLMLVYLVKIVSGYLFFERKEPYPSSLYIMSAMIVMTISIFFNQISSIGVAADLSWRLPFDIIALGLGAYAVRKREQELKQVYADEEAVAAQLKVEAAIRRNKRREEREDAKIHREVHDL